MPKMPELSIRQLPLPDRDNIRDIKLYITQGNLGGAVYNNEGGHGGVRLPSLSRNQQYREYDLGTDRFGGRGNHRLVVLIGSDGKSVEAMYYTDDHYTTFTSVQ